jgi:hypothetical protein
MWLTKIFTAAMVVLTGLLPSSCTNMKGNTSAKSKSPASQQPAHATSAPEVADSSTNRNLGELELTNYYEACVQLGAGKSCRITPKIIDSDNLQLTMSLESKRADGRTTGLSVTQVVTRPGKSFEVAVGDMNLTLTPKLADE